MLRGDIWFKETCQAEGGMHLFVTGWPMFPWIDDRQHATRLVYLFL